MKILALETSAKAVSAAITENGVVLASGYQDTGLTHSRTLMPIVKHLFQNTGIAPQELDAIAVAVGPGSFTGIRIGVSAAKGLAFSLDKPAAAVSTLAAMARNAAFAGGLILCAMDARRGQIYNAVFSAEGGVLTRLTPDRAISLAELAEELRPDARPKIAVGDGARLCADFLNQTGIPCQLAPPHLMSKMPCRLLLRLRLWLWRAGWWMPRRCCRSICVRPKRNGSGRPRDVKQAFIF